MRQLVVAALAAVVLMLAAGVALAQEPIRVTDIAGRDVVLKQPARRIVLGAWVSLDVLSLLDPDPVGLLAGWAEGGANAIQPAIMRATFPGIDKVPVVGRGSLEGLSIETILALKPDLVVLSQFDAFRYGADEATMPTALAQLAAARILVVVVDSFLEPLRNTEASLCIPGRLIGREAQAEAFLTFYRDHLRAIETRLAQAGAAIKPPAVPYGYLRLT